MKIPATILIDLLGKKEKKLIIKWITGKAMSNDRFILYCLENATFLKKRGEEAFEFQLDIKDECLNEFLHWRAGCIDDESRLMSKIRESVHDSNVHQLMKRLNFSESRINKWKKKFEK